MFLRFATRRDKNGNTYKLIIDTTSKKYARENAGFFHRSDYVTMGKRDIEKIQAALISDEYKQVDFL